MLLYYSQTVSAIATATCDLRAVALRCCAAAVRSHNTKQVHSDEDVRIRSDTGWYKRVLNALNVEVTTGVPYTHTSNPLCERQNCVVEQNLRILMKQERNKNWVRLVPWAVLKRYPEPMAHRPEACEPSDPWGSR